MYLNYVEYKYTVSRSLRFDQQYTPLSMAELVELVTDDEEYTSSSSLSSSSSSGGHKCLVCHRRSDDTIRVCDDCKYYSHPDCLQEMISSGPRRCPICKKDYTPITVPSAPVHSIIDRLVVFVGVFLVIMSIVMYFSLTYISATSYETFNQTSFLNHTHNSTEIAQGIRVSPTIFLVSLGGPTVILIGCLSGVSAKAPIPRILTEIVMTHILLTMITTMLSYAFMFGMYGPLPDPWDQDLKLRIAYYVCGGAAIYLPAVIFFILITLVVYLVGACLVNFLKPLCCGSRNHHIVGYGISGTTINLEDASALAE